jgi:hypothetical protein
MRMNADLFDLDQRSSAFIHGKQNAFPLLFKIA